MYSVYDEGGSTTSPIYDSAGSPGTTRSLEIMYDDYDDVHGVLSNDRNFTLSLQVWGCTITTSNGTAAIDIVTNSLRPGNEPADVSLNRTWEVWEPQNKSGNLYVYLYILKVHYLSFFLAI
jgi:hypothetical protein